MRKNLLDRALLPINRFIHYENSAGIALFSSVLLAIIWANSPWHESYHTFWHYNFTIGFDGFDLSYSLHDWVNDGLMAIFFFMVGLELKREIMVGELASWKKAALPLVAAVGGTLVPALIYLTINQGMPTEQGWGIPMATDIVFALVLLAMTGKHVPISAKIFLIALATIDDMVAVLVIALFYTVDLSFTHLIWGLIILTIMVVANKLGVRSTLFYATVGIIGVWRAFLLSGIHATIAGVLAAFAIPARRRINESLFSRKIRMLMHHFDDEIPEDGPLTTDKQHGIIEKIKTICAEVQTPLQKIEGALHPIVYFLVIPLFALSNAGVTVEESFFTDLANPVTVGVFLGLVVGKFAGILGFSWISVKLNFASLPKKVTWRQISGIAALAGVGFTMSLFITQLAFEDSHSIDMAKYGIMLASIVSGLVGYYLLKSQMPVKIDPRYRTK
ncbi:MAG: Na+/H+ antiporter NhaA [Lunatimonas sp.]|uniref:Na+/H+ antiporter NhaA n=1 Tax=Lunatimonas sp. TaxID=2060141 RepID=UPI00263AC91B|nr:Na+/H+ antiporter NhaA [Lunatimonas sp.]MCC5938748.1 Na+/H+ antiporter NhaA [Lunatimonas sp.]